jgi:Flp pilus assembly protein TadG
MRWRREEGVAAVEFALVLPIFLTLVVGIAEFSVALFDKAVITNASREAVCAGIVLAVPKLTTAQIQTVAQNYCGANLVNFGSSSTPAVAVTGAQGNFGTPLSVTVTYTYHGLAVGALLNTLTGPVNITATTVMNNE